MFGIKFIFHPELRRILTDYGFCGYPLKKDFPLTGYIEVFYNDKLNIISFKVLELAQSLRFFKFQSP